MLIKVCGIKYPENLKAVAATNPDLMGFIFYEGSPRFMGNHLTPDDLACIPAQIVKTGVFVNEATEKMLQAALAYQLNAIQLHGAESIDTCLTLKEAGYLLFKAFQVSDDFDFNETEAYASICDLLILDAKGAGFGGNGVPFNWKLLDQYTANTPFLLSGGICPEDLPLLGALQHPQLAGYDINSKFELQPGEKDAILVADFINNLRKQTK